MNDAEAEYNRIKAAWDEAEEDRIRLEEEDMMRWMNQSWEDAKSYYEEEKALYDDLMAEVEQWNAFKNAEADTELWREYDKGAKEALARAEEQKEWMDSAKAWYDDEDQAKTDREEEAENARIAQEALEAYERRDRSIWKLESQIADLQADIDGIGTEMENLSAAYEEMTEDEREAADGVALLEEYTTAEEEAQEKQWQQEEKAEEKAGLLEERREEDEFALEAAMEAANELFFGAEEAYEWAHFEYYEAHEVREWAEAAVGEAEWALETVTDNADWAEASDALALAREALEDAEGRYYVAEADYYRVEEEIHDFLWETEEASEAFERGPQGWDDLGHEAPDDLWEESDDDEGDAGDGSGDEGSDGEAPAAN